MSRHGIFVSWAGADVASVIGSRLTTLAVPWFVLSTTGSSVQTGLAAFAQLAPMVVTKALAGPLLDRIGPARAASRLDAASAAVAAGIPALFAAGRLSFPALLALIALLGALRGPADAAKYALVPRVATAAGQPIERVTGVAGTTERLASTAGVAGGGLLIAAVGATNALVGTAVGFCLSALSIAVAVAPRLARAVPAGSETPDGADEADATAAEAPAGYRRAFADGWAYLRGEPVLLAITVMVAVTNALDQAWATVLVPVWAQQHGQGSATVGMVFAVVTGAAVLGSLLAAAAGSRMPRLLLYTVGYVLAGLPRYVAFAVGADLGPILAVMAISGIASGVLNPIVSAVMFERIPEGLVARVTSLITATAWSLMPFGGLVGGVLAERTGLPTALWTLGGLYLLATLAPLVLPPFRELKSARSRARIAA